MPDVIWTVEGAAAPVLWIIYLGGWVLMFVATNLIDGQALMGLRQVEAYWNDRRLDPLEFQTPSLYRSVRNPIMTGFLVAFWVTPRMTLGHLLFAIGSTSYILVGTKLEERDLLAAFGRRYREYRDDVPAFVPRPWRLAPRPRPDDRD
jgi:protein-S-isoprenylcysteine O-methyltransferase Ste14